MLPTFFFIWFEVKTSDTWELLLAQNLESSDSDWMTRKVPGIDESACKPCTRVHCYLFVLCFKFSSKYGYYQLCTRDSQFCLDWKSRSGHLLTNLLFGNAKETHGFVVELPVVLSAPGS